MNFRTPRGLGIGLVLGEAAGLLGEVTGLRCGELLYRKGEWSLLLSPLLLPPLVVVSGAGLLVRERGCFFLALRSTGGMEMVELFSSSTTSLFLYKT